MPKRVALHLRVSPNKQTTQNQPRELRGVAKRQVWLNVHVFEAAGISGAKGRNQCPGQDAMLRGVARKDFDLVATWSVDRLCHHAQGSQSEGAFEQYVNRRSRW